MGNKIFLLYFQWIKLCVFSSGLVANGWGCDQFGGAELGIYPPLRSSLRADPISYPIHPK